MSTFKALTRFIFLCAILFPESGSANIRLPSVLADNMVLQRNAETRLWGWSNAAEKIIVTLSWNGKIDSVTANGDARWSIRISTPAAGGPYSITLKGQNTIVLKNILIGEVWVC